MLVNHTDRDAGKTHAQCGVGSAQSFSRPQALTGMTAFRTLPCMERGHAVPNRPSRNEMDPWM